MPRAPRAFVLTVLVPLLLPAQAFAESGPGEKAGRNFFNTIQPGLWWFAVGIFACLCVANFAGKNISRLVILVGAFSVIVIPILSPTGFQHMMQGWADALTKNF